MKMRGYIVLISILALIVGITIVTSGKAVNANNSQELIGWAWSSNIGWVSFNCSNENSCDDVDYSVEMASGGNLSGYAWNDNIGWISFNQSELSGCPSSQCRAKISQSTNLLEGWAKALSADDDGWDGWISLSGSGGSWSYGPTLDDSDSQNSVFEGYAWGSDVIGWLKFDPYAGLGVRLAAQPSYFSLQKSNDIETIIISENSTLSGTTTISVLPIGNFSANISLSVTASFVPGSTYTLDGNTCVLDEVCANINSTEYADGIEFYVTVPDDSNGSGNITISGEGSSFISTVDITLNIKGFDPEFDEF